MIPSANHLTIRIIFCYGGEMFWCFISSQPLHGIASEYNQEMDHFIVQKKCRVDSAIANGFLFNLCSIHWWTFFYHCNFVKMLNNCWMVNVYFFCNLLNYFVRLCFSNGSRLVVLDCKTMFANLLTFKVLVSITTFLEPILRCTLTDCSLAKCLVDITSRLLLLYISFWTTIKWLEFVFFSIWQPKINKWNH